MLFFNFVPQLGGVLSRLINVLRGETEISCKESWFFSFSARFSDGNGLPLAVSRA
jgi:hypothetical protein